MCFRLRTRKGSRRPQGRPARGCGRPRAPRRVATRSVRGSLLRAPAPHLVFEDGRPAPLRGGKAWRAVIRMRLSPMRRAVGRRSPWPWAMCTCSLEERLRGAACASGGCSGAGALAVRARSARPRHTGRPRTSPPCGGPSVPGRRFLRSRSLAVPRWPFCFISRCPCPGCHVQHSVAQSDAGEFASCVFLQESCGFTAHSHAVNAARVHFCTFCVFECVSITGSSVRTAAAAARRSLLSITLHRDGRQLSTRRGFPCDFSVPCDLAPPCSFYLHVFMLHDIFT